MKPAAPPPREASESTSGGPLPDRADALPAIDFTTLVISLSQTAFVHLGDVPHPDGEGGERNLPMARQTIDLLGVLQDKTRGNLDGEEERLLDQVLYELRSRFVELSPSAESKATPPGSRTK